MNKPTAYVPEIIYTGIDTLRQHAVVVDCGIIKNIVPKAYINASHYNIITLDNKLMLPAFIDMQLYGAEGKLLAEYPTVDTVALIANYCYNSGTHYCLPTVATNTKEIIYACINAVQQYIEQGGKHVLGIHIEGPWINKEKKGAHIEACIHEPSLQEVTELLAVAKGVIKMITLAPENCSKEIIDLLQMHGIIVAAGHSNATYSVAQQSFDEGISCATHLYNAMSGLQHRNAGMVGAIFNNNKVKASIIPDGHHVSFEAIEIAYKIMGSRLYAITDAVTTTTKGHYQHTLVGDKYQANGVLSGSALTMFSAFKNLIQKVSLPISAAIQMCSNTPAEVLKMHNKIGFIKEGYLANLIVTDESFTSVETICFNRDAIII